MQNYPKAERIKHIQLWKESGVSCEEYCKQNNLHPNTLYRWRKKLKSKAERENSEFVRLPDHSIPTGPDSNIIIETGKVKITLPSSIATEQLTVILGKVAEK